MTLKLKRLLFPNKEQERGTNWQVLHVAAVHCSEDHGTVCPSIQIIQSEVPHQRRSRVNKQVHTVQRERESPILGSGQHAGCWNRARCASILGKTLSWYSRKGTGKVFSLYMFPSLLRVDVQKWCHMLHMRFVEEVSIMNQGIGLASIRDRKCLLAHRPDSQTFNTVILRGRSAWAKPPTSAGCQKRAVSNIRRIAKACFPWVSSQRKAIDKLSWTRG